MSPTIAPTPVATSPVPARTLHTPRVRGAAMVFLACAALLVPWAAWLATSLPQTYVISNWNGAWVGFDVLLIVVLGATGVLARRQHPLLAPAAFASAAFLVADAWFDVMTAESSDRLVALVSAVLIELPLAALLLRHATTAAVATERP